MLTGGELPGSHGPGRPAATAEMFHTEVRRRRHARGLSRDELAERTGYSRRYVSQLEQPSRGVPPRPVVVAVDAALQADGALIVLRDEAAARRASPPRDPADESRRRVENLLRVRRCDGELDLLDRAAGELVVALETVGPWEARARVLRHQELVDDLLDTQMLPHQQFRLYLIAGHLAALLAIALLDLDELGGASTCSLEAAVFTELTDHEGLRALSVAVNRLVGEAARTTTAGRPADASDMVRFAPRARTARDRKRVRRDAGTGRTRRVALPIAATARDTAAGKDTAAISEIAPAAGLPEWEIGDLITVPDLRASTPRLVALVKMRIARLTAADLRPERPLAGISRAFQPPV